MTRIALLSTSDTDLLSARSSGADYALANPSRLDVDDALPAVIADADLVVVRLLGSVRSWQDGFDVVLGADRPVVVLGGEQTPDAELMSHSTVPVGTAAEAHRYLAEGGPANLANLHAFLSDTVLLTGEGFEPPAVLPAWGWAERAASDLPKVGVLYYRAHEASGNSAFAHAAGRRDRRHRRSRRRPDLQLVAALGAGRPLRRTRRPRRPDRHGARGRRHDARHPRARAATTRPGTSSG